MVSQQFIKFDPQARQLTCLGEWNLAHLVSIKAQLGKIAWPQSGAVTVDGSAVAKLDSAAAWLLRQSLAKLVQHGLTVSLQGFSAPQKKLLSLIEKQTEQITHIPKVHIPPWLARFGKRVVLQINEFREFLAFVGELTLEVLRLCRHPSRYRLRALASVIETTGYQALFIIALLSFMIGVVMTYQMGLQLKSYGANIFIVDLLGLSILREFAPLLTAIMVAGRTGSAFTAQLGTMKINQEIDALNTMGVTPAELLLLPRIMGLVIVLPLLVLWADVFAIFGGMVMAKNLLGISWHDFLTRFQQVVALRSLIIGLGKAPVFALIIASIGCFQGMKAADNADSIGKQTTRSVVLAIFFIIVADAIFSVLFSKFGI